MDARIRPYPHCHACIPDGCVPLASAAASVIHVRGCKWGGDGGEESRKPSCGPTREGKVGVLCTTV